MTLTSFTADAAGQTGAFEVPAANVPAAAFQPASATSGSSVEAISFFHSSFFHSSFFHSSFFHSSFFHSSFFHSGLTDTSFFHSSFFHSSFFHSPLDTTLLSDIPLAYPDPCGDDGHPACTGWDGLLRDTNSALAGQPIQMITLLDVLDDEAVAPVLGHLQIGDVDLTHTPLGDLPFAAMALGGIPLKRLPLIGVAGSTPMAQWCNVLATPANSIDCAGDLGIDPQHPDAVPWSGGVSVVTLALLGVSMDNLPLDSIALATLDSNGHPLIDLTDTPLGDAPVSELDLASSSLGAVLLGNLAMRNTTLGTRTLADVALTATPVGAVPLSTVTVDAIPVGAPVGGTLGAVGLSSANLAHVELGPGVTAAGAPLSRLVLNATFIGSTPLSALALSGSAGIGSITYGQLGSLLGTFVDCSSTLTDCTNLSLTLADAEAAGVLGGTVADLAGHGLSAFDTTTLGALVDSLTPSTITLDQLVEVLNSTDRAALTLASVVPGLPAAVPGAVQLADLVAHSTGAAGLTLVQLIGALHDSSAITVGDLLHGLDHQAVTLGDLLVGFLSASPEDLPFEHLDLSGVDLPPLANHGPNLSPSISYTGSLNVTDGGPGSPAHVVFTATLPQGFDYEPNSTRIDGALPATEPVASVGPTHEPVLTWTQDLDTAVHTLTFRAWAGLSETEATVTGEAHLDGDGAGTAIPANTTIADVSSANPDTPFPMVPGDLYLGHLKATRSIAYYSVQVPAGGQRLSLILGNLPADYDLVLYALGSASHLRGAPTRTIVPVDDGQLSLAPLDQSLPAETLQDVPLLAGRVPYSVSANRNRTDERIDTGQLDAGTYLVQVSAFNGAADSVNPYTLRARLIADPAATCPGTHTFAFPTDTADTLPPAVPTGAYDTVVLVNSGRLAKTWGSAAEQQVMDSLAGFAGQHPVNVVTIDSSANVRDDYDTWDRDPCSVTAANQIVTDIGHVLDGVTAANPALRYVVLVGADNLLPMGRVRDATVLANERTFAQAFPGAANELTASLAGGYVLSDDPYSTATPVSTAGRDVFVPQLSVGRLVETPAQISKALDDFVAQHGALPSSATALATGYDFMRDGAQAVATGLGAGGSRPVDTSLIGDSWTKGDLAGKLFPAGGSPSISSINGHFDQSAMLPATGGAANAFTVDDIPAAAPPGPTPLQARLLFSMGCHAGFNVPEQLGAAGTTADWADTFAQQGALWIANTGYGYGDDKTVALSEHLMALVAGELDHAGSIGAAYVAAKRAYASGLAVASPYDEKTLMEATFYGLPMYALPAPPNATPLPALGVPGTPTVDASFGLAGAPAVYSAPIAKIIPDGTSAPAPGAFDFVRDGSGSALDGHYEIDGQTVAVQQRPIQPKVELDALPGAVSAVLPNGYVAKGALLSGLTSTDYAGFQPDFFRPSLDNRQAEQSQNVGDAAFPAGIQTMTTYRDAGGATTQHLVLVPAQFRPTPGLDVPGRGTERLFTQLSGKVLYGPDNGDDTPPTVFRWSASVTDTTLTMTAHVEDLADSDALRFTGVKVVTVLYSLSSAPGVWHHVDLQPTGLSNIGDWSGTATVPMDAKADAILQAVRWNGSVATSSMKAAFFNAQATSSTGPFRFRLTGGVRADNGWWKVAPSVVVVLPLGDTLTQLVRYQVDDAAPRTYTGPFSIGGDGIHNITISQTGFNDSHLQVLVDSTAPNPAIGFPTGPNVPTINGEGWFNKQPLNVEIVPTDPGGGQGSGVDTVTYSATGANPIPLTTANEPPVGQVITAPISADGETTFHVSAKDRAGNVSVNGNFPVDLDTQKPNVTVTPTPALPSARNGWNADTVNVTISATDPLPPAASGKIASGVASITYELNGHPSPTVDARNADGSWPMTFETSFDVADEGITTLSIDVIDVAGNDDHEVRVVQIDRTAPATTAAVTPAPNVDGFNGPAGTTATVNFTAVDGPGDGVPATDVSGIDHVTYSATGAQTVSATNGTSLVVNKEGATTVTFFATDVAGNIETSKTVVVKLDFTAPTVQIPLPDSSANLPVGPPTMKTYLLGQPETLSYSCADDANGSGLASCGGAQEQVPGITGLQDRNLNGALDTSHVGLHTVFVTGTDKVGNSFTQSVPFRVVYNVCPQYDPTKAISKGSTIAIKLRLCTYSGTNVSSSTLSLRAYQVDNGTPLLTPNSAGSSNLGFLFRYDPSTSTYIYNLQTTKKFPTGANVMTFTVSGDPVTPVVTTAPPAGYSNLLYRAVFRLK